jgi:putative addiction module antidote
VKLKIRKIGNSLGASIPKEILEKMNVGEGDSLYVTQTPDGIYLTLPKHHYKMENLFKRLQQLPKLKTKMFIKL